MFLILAGHFLWQCGSGETTFLPNKLFLFIAGQAPRIGTGGFLVLGCYFMAGSRFKAERVVKLWLQELFYTATITLLMIPLRPGVVNKEILWKAVRPVTGFFHWYVSVYIALILLAPFLNKVLELDRAFLRKFLAVLFLFVCLWSTVMPFGYADTPMEALLWFLSVFLWMGYYKKYLQGALPGKWRWLLLAVGLYALFNLVLALPTFGINNRLLSAANPYASQFLLDYKTLPNLVVCFSLFEFFSKIDIGTQKVVNWFASSTLAVYIVHQVPVFYPYLWENILHTSRYINSPFWIPYAFLVMILLFGGIILLDKLRIRLLERPLMKTPLLQLVCTKLNSFYTFGNCLK